MSDGTPILTEQRTDRAGTYTCEWYCQPPAQGITHRVTDCTWTPDHKTRKIYAIALGQGRDQR